LAASSPSARRFSSPALPDPGPLPDPVPIPHAEPPEDMALIAVPTGVNNRVAAYAYRGGSVFDRRVVVPSHDQRAYAEMARLPHVTTTGLLR
jgi:hypothetical protein